MPFKSKAQAGFMFAHHPEVAKEFAAKTPSLTNLPEHVKAKPPTETKSPWLMMGKKKEGY